MRTVLVTGPIGSGKSAVCNYLTSRGYHVYDCDSRTKDLYARVPGLVEKIEESLGVPFSDISVIFSDEVKMRRLEDIVIPLVTEDFKAWRRGLDAEVCFVESATAMRYPTFMALCDEVWMVSAPYSTRLHRNPKVAERDAVQKFDESLVTRKIVNDSDLNALYEQIDLLI